MSSKNIKNYRKRINELEKQIGLYKNYQAQLISFVTDLKHRYQNREIGYEEYHSIITNAFKEKSFRGWLNYYDALIDISKQKIDRFKEYIKQQTPKQQKNILIVLGLIFFLAIVFSFAIYKYGPEITGYTVFTREVGNRDILNLEYNQTQMYVWKLSQPQEINSIMVSGKITGRGKVRIYLQDDNTKYLLYEAFNEGRILNFNDVCMESCVLPRLNKTQYLLRLEVEDSTLILKSITYYLIELYDLDIYPKRNVIQFKPNLQQKFEVQILNKEKRNFDAIAYVEGNLSSFISLSESLLHFSGEDAQKINYEISLPDTYKSGTYYADLIVRYVPKGKFRGESPKIVHTIELKVPYEDVVASADLQINRISENEVEFIIPIVNLGNKEFTAKTIIDIFKGFHKVDTIQTEEVHVYPNYRGEISNIWRSSYGEGRYHALVKIFYANKTLNLEKDFILEESSVLISNIDTTLAEHNKEEVSFDVWVKNELDKAVHDAYFELNVYDRYNNLITTVVSDLVDLEKDEELKITASLNPKEFIPGIYTMKIIMNFDNEQIEKVVRTQITKDSIHILDKEKQIKDRNDFYLIIIIIILIMMNIVWLVHYFKK